MSARPFDAKRLRKVHGGARNRADRVTYSLTAKQVHDIMKSVARASEIGLPLNRHWTIHWERAGMPDDKARAATSVLLTLVRDWLRKQGHMFACVWVRENDNGDGSKGSHVHIIIHVPAGVKWCGWRNRRWLERVTGQRYVAGVGLTRAIGGSSKAAWASPSLFYANLGVVAGYVSKGVTSHAVGASALRRNADGGRIIGKRWGRSQNLGWRRPVEVSGGQHERMFKIVKNTGAEFW